MKVKTNLYLVAWASFLFLAFDLTVIGQPVYPPLQVRNSFILFKDLKESNVFYYSPKNIEIAQHRDGSPDMLLLMMLQSGSNIDNRINQIRFTNMFQSRVSLVHPMNKELDSLQSYLKKKYQISDIQIRPLTLANIESHLVLSSEGQIEQKWNGVVEPTSESEALSSWGSRIFSVKVDDYAAQLLEAAFNKNQAIAHIGYTLSALCATINSQGIMTKHTALHSIDSIYIQTEEIEKTDTLFTVVPIFSSTLPLAFDAQLHTDLIRKIDITSGSPPGYALFEVRCYDFLEAIRPDLFGRRVEIEAVGMNNRPVRHQITFYENSKEITTQWVRFRYAIRLDRPIQYRIVDLSEDRPPFFHPWRQKELLTDIIDITSQQRDQKF